MKYIKIQPSTRSRICRALGISRVTLWSALTYQTQSALAERIRRLAIHEGGRVVCEVDVTNGFSPNCETTFSHGDSTDGHVRQITQTFANGVEVVLMGEEAMAEITRNGTPVKSYANVTLGDWMQIAYEAQSLSDSLSPQLR